MNRPLSSPALQVLSGATAEGALVKLNAGTLDRKLYVEIDKALQALGGKWNRRLEGHVFQEDPSELLRQVCDNGGYLDRRKALQFYETPAELAARMVQLADLKDGAEVLEPSAGHGAILRALPTNRGILVDAMEIDPLKIPVLEALQAERRHTLINVLELDFLETLPVPTYDCVLMNPPFTRGQDAQHIRHACGFLRPGGRLVAVASAGVLVHENRAAVDFRAFLVSHGGTVERLPEHTFRSSGTDASTVLIQVSM